MIKFYKILSGIVVFLGTGHTVLTPVFYKEFDIELNLENKIDLDELAHVACFSKFL